MFVEFREHVIDAGRLADETRCGGGSKTMIEMVCGCKFVVGEGRGGAGDALEPGAH